MVVRYAEHFKDLSDAFRKVSNHEKANILRGLGIYFIVGPDKYITVMNAQYEELFIIQ